MPTQKVLNQIITKHNGIREVYTIGDIIEGYYDSLNDKFYKEDTFETEIEGAEGFLYIDKAENKTYRYNIDELTYILTSGGGDSIVHVKKLPAAADIEDKIYIVGKEQETVTTTATEANIDGLCAFNKIVNEDDNITSWNIKNKYTVYLDDGDPATDNMNVTGIIRDSSNNYTFSDGTATTVFAEDAAFTVEVLGPVNTYLGNKDNKTVMLLDREIVRVTELPVNPNIEDKVYLYDDYEEVVVSDGYTTLSGTADLAMFEAAPFSDYFIQSGDEFIVNNAWIAYLGGKLDKPILKVINNTENNTLEVVLVDSGEPHVAYSINTDTITFKITDVAHPTPDPVTVIELNTYYYLGDNINQTLIPLSGGGSSYRQGSGIRIDAGLGNEISTTDFVGTLEEWEELEPTEKNKYDLLFFDDTYNTEYYPGHGIQDKDNVIKPSRKLMQLKDFKITDDPDTNKTIVEEIPYTAGEGIDIDADEKEISVSDEVPKVWTGTKAEWAAVADKSVYDGWLIDITDDVLEGSQPVVDVAEEGNYNPISSNGVYQLLSSNLKTLTVDCTIEFDTPGAIVMASVEQLTNDALSTCYFMNIIYQNDRLLYDNLIYGGEPSTATGLYNSFLFRHPDSNFTGQCHFRALFFYTANN